MWKSCFELLYLSWSVTDLVTVTSWVYSEAEATHQGNKRPFLLSVCSNFLPQKIKQKKKSFITNKHGLFDLNRLGCNTDICDAYEICLQLDHPSLKGPMQIGFVPSLAFPSVVALVSKWMPYFTSCFCFNKKLWTSPRPHVLALLCLYFCCDEKCMSKKMVRPLCL